MEVLAENPLCFEIEKEFLNKHDRLDSHYLHPVYLELEEQLVKSPYELKTLAGISESIFCGSTPKDYNSFANKGILFLKTVNVQDGWLDLKERYYISKKSHSKRKNSEVRKNDLLMTIIGANEEVVGRVVLVREDISANVNQNIAGIRIRKIQVLPEYVEAFLSTRTGRNLILRISRTATRVNMNLKEVKAIRIPIPPKKIQEKIIKIMERARTERKQNLKEAERLEKEVDDFFLKKLGLAYPEEKEESVFIAELDERFDPYYYHPRFKQIMDSFSGGEFRLKKLKEVVEFSNKQIDPKKEPNRLFKYIQIQNIDKVNRKISSYTPILGKDAPGRAKMLIKEGDILLPILGGSLKSIAIVPKEFDDEVATNGFAILRTDDANFRHYVFHYLITEFSQIQIERQLTGAIMSSISKSELENLLIPLPPPTTQESIAKKIQEVNIVIEKLQEEADGVINRAKEEVEKIIIRR